MATMQTKKEMSSQWENISCKSLVASGNQRLLNFKSLVLAPPNIRSFLRFLPNFWLNTTVFLHIRF